MTLKPILRRFAQAPMFTAMAVLTLAIGIGANTAIFSVVNGVLIKPLAYPDADELISLSNTAPGAGFPDAPNSPTMYFTYRDEGRAFEQLGLWQPGAASVTGLADPEQVRAVRVTYGTLQALAVPPALGRWFSLEDDTPGTPETVMITHGYWQRRFGGDRTVVGRGLTIDSRPREVIGVMPEGFRVLETDADIILPFRFERSRLFLGNFSFQGLARLKDGVTLAQAEADVRRMLPNWLQAWPAPMGLDRKVFENARIAPAFKSLKQEVVGDVAAVLWVLMGTIGVVLLIACANVANLLLVRVEGRQEELATRAALGADWKHIAEELLQESLLLGVIGGALGLALAYAALQPLTAIGPDTLPRLGEITIDPLVLGFALAASLLSGLLFGTIPVMKYGGPQLALMLRGSARTSSDSRQRHRARNTLVVVQVALALVLLIASGLMIRTFLTLRGVQPGFSRPEQLQMVRIAVPPSQVTDPGRVARVQHEILDRLATIPGISAAAFVSSAPLEGFNSNDPIVAEDKTYAAGQIPPIRRLKFVSPGLFRALGTPLVAGRDITWDEVHQDRQVAVVSENLAREMWGAPAAALGKRIRIANVDAWREIVGVVGDVHDNGVQEPAPATVYWPTLMRRFWGNEQYVQRGVTFVLRSDRTGTEGLLAQVREAVWAVDRNLPLALVRTLDDVYDESMARTSFTVVMLAVAGAMALLLGIIGIYGVISYAVSKRTREIGIRMALGMPPGELRRMFVRDGILLAMVGVVAGLAAAIGLTRLLTSLLFQVSPLDPLTYAAVSVLLLFACVLASYMPARRATALDPVDALRAD